MNRYKLSAPRRNRHELDIEARIPSSGMNDIMIYLPNWRPGRYEMGNFAKNILNFSAEDAKGNALPFAKVTKNCWKVHCEGQDEVVLNYSYYAAQADAGACWVDEELVYVNPVHCMMYAEESMDLPAELILDLPDNYAVATSLEEEEPLHFRADNFHELVDSPFMASEHLSRWEYTVGKHVFHIWLQGESKVLNDKVLNDFKKFSEEQIEMMESFPVKEFHFLVLLLPYKFYHGVEHLRSTVLALGPGTALLETPLYTDFIGVASHELFHVWNIKTIRPAGMLPYRYQTENYSRLGYVYEGVTTYYGDLILARCGVYTVDEFFEELKVRLQKHFHNFGRFQLPVADSSFDTWLDGYVPGVPDRKTSIYDEGCLLALMTDLLIRHHSENKHSLDDVMRTLYNDFGKKGIAYTDHHYLEIVNRFAGVSLLDFFMDFVYGTEDDEPVLEKCLSYAGCELVREPSGQYHERYFGFKTKKADGKTKVESVVPGSVADRAGLSREDTIVALNEINAENNLNDLLNNYHGQKVVLTVITPMEKLKELVLKPGKAEFYPTYSIRRMTDAGASQQQFFKKWLKQEFETADREEKIKS